MDVMRLMGCFTATGVLLTTAVATPAAAASTVVARYRFDQRLAGARVDGSGHGHTLRVVARHGGSARSVRHGAGLALAFPAPCRGSRCPKIVLQAGSTPALNPGRRPLRFGAAVLLPRGRTTAGQNIVQKGYWDRGGQYKLQIDGTAGRPSCGLIDSRRGTVRLVRSSRTVADGRWHRLECRRSATRLHIIVDGLVRGFTAVPAGLTIANGHPLSLGGKSANARNDQFHGVLDDVFVAIG
ncbi:MAG TPA: LamG-like jellyroll fold domain-containing protein [Actinoplanes sp.]|nr:LamG-like jellyroll fold domain-containing protein [Actinoplanes sp.]